MGPIDVETSKETFQTAMKHMKLALQATMSGKANSSLVPSHHEGGQSAEALTRTRNQLKRSCQLAERHLLLQERRGLSAPRPRQGFQSLLVDWMRCMVQKVGLKGIEVSEPSNEIQISFWSSYKVVDVSQTRPRRSQGV